MISPVATITRSQLLLFFLPMSAATVLCWKYIELYHANLNHIQAVASQHAVQSDIAELQRLETASTQLDWGTRPNADVLALARQAVTQAGLPADCLQGITPAGDRLVTYPNQQQSQNAVVKLREQSVRITLRTMTAHSLGAFLQAWQQTTDRWVVTSIDLTLAIGRGTQEGSYTTVLVVTAPYAEGEAP